MGNEGSDKELHDGVRNDLEVAFQKSLTALDEELEQITSFESSNGSSDLPAVYDEDDLGDDDDSDNVDHLRNELKEIKTSPIYDRRQKDSTNTDLDVFHTLDMAGEMMMDGNLTPGSPNAAVGDIDSDSSFSSNEDSLDEDANDQMVRIENSENIDPFGNSGPDGVMLSKEAKKLQATNPVPPSLLDIDASTPSFMDNETNSQSVIDRSMMANVPSSFGDNSDAEAVGDILVIGDSDSDSSFSYPEEFQNEDSPMKENLINRNLHFSRPDPPSWNFSKRKLRSDPRPSTFTIGVGGDAYSSQLPSLEEYRAENMQRTTYSDHFTSSHKRRLKCSKKCALLACVLVLVPSVLVPLLILQKRFARVEQVVLFLVQNDISTDTNLRNSKSPQTKAAKWIANTDFPRVAPSMHNDFLDRYVLAVLYFALGGDTSWAHSLKFLDSEHVCNWGQTFNDDKGNGLVYGVTECHEIDNKQVPVQLSLAFQNLRGTLPDELRFLTGLEALSLQYNTGLVGDFPSSIRSLQNLRRLSLEKCFFSGTLPGWLNELTELTTLMLGDNVWTGSVPPSLTSMTQLRTLGLDNNELVSDLSQSFWGSLSNLEYLYLDSNEVRGKLDPSLLVQWQNLRELDLSRNQISGNLPENLLSHKKLRVVDLHGNRIGGTIPELEVMANGSLQYLALHENFLTKRIPTTIGFLVALKHLDLSFNNLTGILPNTLENIFNLEYLFAGGNSFQSAAFPQFLLEMDMLTELSLREIDLTGTLPDEIDSLSNLKYLDLSQNQMTGTIPESVGALSALQYLNMESNMFSGTLPHKLSQLGNLEMVLLAQNKLEGHTDMLCEESSTENIGIFVTDCEEPTLSCPCCTVCCSSSDLNCNSIDIGQNLDLKWEFGYRRDGEKQFAGTTP